VFKRIRTLTLLAALLVAAPASAQDLQIDTGPICDTQRQAERLAELFGENDQDSAIKIVNTEEKNPIACGVVTIAFFEGPRLETVRHKVTTFVVVKILVLGVLLPTGFEVGSPAVYFTVKKGKEKGA